MPSVFISYSSADKLFVRTLAKRLDEEGVKVWLDERELDIGSSLIQKIAEAIEQMDYVVAIISRKSVKSEWVQTELNLAMTKEVKGKRLIVLPLLIQKCELPEFLKHKLYGNFLRKENFESEFLKLLRTLRVKKTSPADVALEKEKGSTSSLSFIHQRKMPKALLLVGIVMLSIVAVVLLFMNRSAEPSSAKSPLPIEHSQTNNTTNLRQDSLPNNIEPDPKDYPKNQSTDSGRNSNSFNSSASKPDSSTNSNPKPANQNSSSETSESIKPTQGVRVRLTPVYYLDSRRLQSVGMPVTISTSTGRFSQNLNSPGYVQFNDIPCGEEITIVISDVTYNGGIFPPITYKRFINCGKSLINLGELIVSPS